MATRFRVLHKKKKRFLEREQASAKVKERLKEWRPVRPYPIDGKYILDGKTPVPCYDLMTWGLWMETNNHHIADDDINGVRVSTVFLGLDHNHLRLVAGGPPVLFETLVFGGKLDMEMERYATWEEAERGHAAMRARVEQSEEWPKEI